MHDNDTCGLRVIYEIRELVEPVPGKLMQDELVEAIRRIIAERDAARATIAKLPTYANGEAFVPGVDECVTKFNGVWNLKTVPHWNSLTQTWEVIADWFPRVVKFYPTAAECEAAERKETE
jgi:hypothetical protein